MVPASPRQIGYLIGLCRKNDTSLQAECARRGVSPVNLPIQEADAMIKELLGEDENGEESEARSEVDP